MKINKVEFKVIVDRQRMYIAMVQFFMIGYLFFEKVGFNWWYLVFIPFWLWFIWYDLRKIIPAEQGYYHEKSPVFMEMLRNTRKILIDLGIPLEKK